MSKGADRGRITLAIFGVAILLNLILTLMLLDQVERVREEVRDLPAELASKQDVAMLHPIRVQEILEQRCQRCHTERRFAATWDMSETEILTTIHRMRSHPGGEEIPGEEVPLIGAALVAFRCTSCHGDGVLSRLTLMTGQERDDFLRKKVIRGDSGFRPDQVGLVTEAFEILTKASN